MHACHAFALAALICHGNYVIHGFGRQGGALEFAIYAFGVEIRNACEYPIIAWAAYPFERRHIIARYAVGIVGIVTGHYWMAT